MEKEAGLVSSFNFVPERYRSPLALRDELARSGFEVAVHDLTHDGKLYQSEAVFLRRAQRINHYLREWRAVGFRSGSMFHNLEWIHKLNMEYDSSTFDTDPFEPQPDGLHTVFPMWIPNQAGDGGYVELPYTLPHDMTLFVILQHSDIHLWKEKLSWIASRGGMALVDTHPDYMYWGDGRRRVDEYPSELYREFLQHIMETYPGQFWNALPRDVARYWRNLTAARV